ncbi:MAG TPA: hypothetical protein VLM40_18145, partial [Gemmata sp.]|nr:hypothetical protein [Gemmata sp.]
EAEEEMRREHGQGVVPWLALAVLAAVLFELFAHPLMAASVFCLKFAFNDFITARWLIRRDPIRGRGRCCGLLYVASGFWKAALVNFGMFTAALVFTVVSGIPAWPQRPANAPPPDFFDDPLTPWLAPTVFGHLIEFVLGMIVLAVAFARHQKLWLSPRIHIARRLDQWPPSDAVGVNWLAWRPALTVATVPAIIWGVGFAVITVLPTPPVNPSDWENLPAIHGVFGFLLTLPVVLISACVQDKNSRYLLAHTPEECWGNAAEGDCGAATPRS